MSTGSGYGGLPPPPPRSDDQPSSPEERKRRNPVPIVIGALVLVILLLGGVIYWLNSSLEHEGRGASGQPTRFSEHGLAFDIPTALRFWEDPEDAQLQLTDLPAGVRSPTSGAWYEILTLDPSNLLVIYPDELGFIVDESNIETYAEVSTAVVSQALGEAVGVEPGSVAGLPSIAVEAHEVDTPLGPATNELVEVFDENHGYVFMCQYTDGASMDDLCQTVLDDLSVEAAERTGWTAVDSGGGHRIDIPPGWAEESPVATELIHAVFSSPGGDVPIAELQLTSEAVFGDSPPPRRFVNDVVRNLKGSGFELLDRSAISIPAGEGEKLVLRAQNTRYVVIALVHEAQGITIGLATFSDQQTMDLLAPTADAVARSLTIGADAT